MYFNSDELMAISFALRVIANDHPDKTFRLPLESWIYTGLERAIEEVDARHAKHLKMIDAVRTMHQIGHAEGNIEDLETFAAEAEKSYREERPLLQAIMERYNKGE